MFAQPSIDDAKKDAVEVTEFYPGFRSDLSGGLDIGSLSQYVARMFACPAGSGSEQTSGETCMWMELETLRYVAGFFESPPETHRLMVSWLSKEIKRPVVSHLVSQHDDFSHIPERLEPQVTFEAVETEYDEDDFAEFHLKMKPKHYIKSVVPLRFRGQRRPPELPLDPDY